MPVITPPKATLEAFFLGFPASPQALPLQGHNCRQSFSLTIASVALIEIFTMPTILQDCSHEQSIERILGIKMEDVHAGRFAQAPFPKANYGTGCIGRLLTASAVPFVTIRSCASIELQYNDFGEFLVKIAATILLYFQQYGINFFVQLPIGTSE